MWIIGCDFHVGFQQVAIFDRTSREIAIGGCSIPRRRARFTRL
jgi:hypothetical protein